MKRLTSTFLLTTLLAACGTDSDIWMPSDAGGGKADAFTTIKGSDIPSQHVDPNKSYILSRQIATLQQVGAFDVVQDRLALRIDGIIANMPSDKRLHLAELVRMETSAIHDSLFPEEVAALPTYWKMMEAPTTSDFVVGPDTTFGVVDSATPPGPAVVPANLAITSLAAELQSAATRLQNKHDADGNPSTVQYLDLVNGIAMPGPFTPAEVQAFTTIQAVFRDKAIATSASEIVVSPAPGTYTKDMMVGPIGLHIEGNTTFTEERTNNGSQLLTKLDATQTQITTVALPPNMNAKLVMIDKERIGESTHPAGLISIPGGQYVFELWVAGQRTFHTNVHASDLTRTQTIDLSDKLDYTLVAGLTPLVRNISSATFDGSAIARFSFNKTAVNPTAPVNQIALPRVATPVVKIPVGRYTLPNTNIQLQVFPNNVLWLVSNQQGFRLLPVLNPSTLMPARFFNQPMRATFDPATNGLRIDNQGVALTLSASMRDI